MGAAIRSGGATQKGKTAMTRPDIDADWIPKKPTPFCLVRRSDPPEVRRQAQRKWMDGIIRYESFWAARKTDPAPGDGPAWHRFWCSKCGQRNLHDVNADGEIATCPTCGHQIDLSPEGEFGGMDG